MSQPGETLAVHELRRATLQGGTDVLPSGKLGFLAGTVVGPLPWDVAQTEGDAMTAATVEYGALGVVIDDTPNGSAVVVRVAGLGPVRVSGPALLGKQLCLDPSHPGQLRFDNTGTGVPIARALEASATGGLPVCEIESLPYLPPDASGL